MRVLCDVHIPYGLVSRLLSNTELTAMIEAHWSIIAQIAVQERCYIELSRGGIVRFPRN